MRASFLSQQPSCHAHLKSKDWKDLIFIDLQLIAVMWLTSVMGIENSDGEQQSAAFHSLMFDLVYAVYVDAFIYSKDGKCILIPLRKRSREGKRVYMHCVPNDHAYPRYCLTGKKGGFLTEECINWNLYRQPNKPKTLDVYSVVDFNHVKDVKIGSFHILRERTRLKKFAASVGANYSLQCEALTQCVNNAIKLVKEHPSIAQLYMNQGCIELAIPFMNEHKQIQADLAIILKYDWVSQSIDIPTILESEMVLRDCLNMDLPLVGWLGGR